MLTWQADGDHGLEGARLLLGPGHSLRALSRLIRVGEYTASYRLVVREDGTLNRLSITSATADKERHLTLNRPEEGFWLLDTGSGGGAGGTRTDFGGALDVDLATSPMFNALPIRRLGLHKEAGEHTIPVVWVSLPDLEASVVQQTYRTVSVDEHGAVIAFSSDGFDAEIVVDTDGMVVSYPGIANRLAPTPA
jgi:hypothetical protein